MDYLEEECINLLKLKDLKDYGNSWTALRSGKSKKKRKSSSEESSSEEKVAKRTKTAFEQARKVMKSELDNLGFKGIEDYGNMEWGTFMIEHPEVRQYIKTQCKLQGVKVLCDFWHNRRKKHVEDLKAEQEALAAADDNAGDGRENANNGAPRGKDSNGLEVWGEEKDKSDIYLEQNKRLVSSPEEIFREGIYFACYWWDGVGLLTGDQIGSLIKLLDDLAEMQGPKAEQGGQGMGQESWISESMWTANQSEAGPSATHHD
ncbi:hypothetical protein WJX77_010620 [Trebouxia sp. C0004]